MPNIDLTKTYRTKSGKDVTVYTTSAPSGYPVHGRVEGYGLPCSWKLDGRSFADLNLDLVEVKPKVKLWVRVYRDIAGGFYGGVESGPDRPLAGGQGFAKVQIEVEEGEGL